MGGGEHSGHSAELAGLHNVPLLFNSHGHHRRSGRPRRRLCPARPLRPGALTLSSPLFIEGITLPRHHCPGVLTLFPPYESSPLLFMVLGP